MAAVLRLGCNNTMPTNRANNPSQSPRVDQDNRGQNPNTRAACKIISGFINSEGCTKKGPTANQRVAPLTVIPRVGTRVINNSPSPAIKPNPDSRTSRSKGCRTIQLKADNPIKIHRH